MSYFWQLHTSTPDAIAFYRADSTAVSYADLAAMVNAAQQQLPKTRSLIALKTSNDLQVIIWYLACLQAEHPVILLDSSLNDELLAHLLDTYQPHFLLGAEQFTQRHSTPIDLHPDLAVMLSTSGTTGSPKLVRLSQQNLQANAESIVSYLKLTAQDCAITTMPLHYSYGLSVLNSHLQAKACLVLTDEGLLSRGFWQLVDTHQVSSLAGVPYIWQMLKKMRYERFNTQSIRYITQAGGKLDTETLQYFIAQTNAKNQQFYVMYGQTEATARIAYLPAEALEQKAGSIGRAIPGGTLKIRKAEGAYTEQPLEQGELIYYGANVMLGYAESQADLALGDVQQGCLATGDLGYQDADGYFYITGRLKRFIKIFGLRISLDAVDQLVVERGFVAASTGRDDLLVVFVEQISDVQCKQLHTDLAALLKINANAIRVHAVAALPRTSAGKPDGKALAELMEQYE